MNSIRVRLMGWVLVLLALAIGVLGCIYYISTRNALLAKDAEIKEISHQAYIAKKKLESDNFDDELLRHALRLANLTQVGLPYFDVRRATQLIGNGFNPLFTINSFWPYENSIAFRMVFSTLDMNYTDPDDFFQLSAFIGGSLRVKRSNNLTPNELPLPQRSSTAPLLTPKFETITFPNNKQMRCVYFRSDLTVDPRSSYTRNRSRNSRPPTPPASPPQSNNPPPPFTFYQGLHVQLARPLEELDKQHEALLQDLQKDELREQKLSEDALSNLSLQVVLLSLGTMLIAGLGATWICQRNLKPLTEVADAVSKISPKEFRLIHRGKALESTSLPSELVPIVDRLKMTMSSLELAFAREKQATADISHELRTPIASLLANAQVTLRKKRTETEYQAALEQCVDTAHHLNGLVERLLRLSRLDAGVDTCQKEEIDVADLSEQCVSMLKPIAQEKGIKLSFTKETNQMEGPFVNTDAAKLREVLLNLIDNAIQYTPDNGQVEVLVGHHSSKVRLEVKDNGIGMSPETQASLFQRFFRADHSRHSSKVNAGLGLAIVKGYIELMGGKIEVQSQLGKGTSFIVTLTEIQPSTLPEAVPV